MSRLDPNGPFYLYELLTPRPLDDWHEDFGAALWHRMPIEEPPYCGTPLDSDWPFDEGDTVLWTPLPDGNTIQRRYDNLIKGKKNAI